MLSTANCMGQVTDQVTARRDRFGSFCTLTVPRRSVRRQPHSKGDDGGDDQIEPARLILQILSEPITNRPTTIGEEGASGELRASPLFSSICTRRRTLKRNRYPAAGLLVCRNGDSLFAGAIWWLGHFHEAAARFFENRKREQRGG